MEKLKSIFKNPAFLIFLLTFLISASYSFYFKVRPAVDARAYDNIGWNLARGLGYRELLTVPLISDNAIIRVGPGYEFFLAGIFYFFGHSYPAVWIIQAILLGLSALIIFYLSKLIFRDSWSPSLGIVAAVLIGLSPDLITISSMLMTETLGIFLEILAIYLFFLSIKKNDNFWTGISASGVLGLSLMVRTPLLFLSLPMAGYWLFKKQWKTVIFSFLIGILIFTPWIVRNYKIYNEFLPTNAAGGFNMLTGNHLGASGEQEPYPPLEEYVEKFGYLEANKIAVKEAKNFIFSHPLEFLKITWWRISTYFSFARPSAFWFHLSGASRAITAVLSVIYALALFIAGGIGIANIKSLDKDKKNNAFLLLGMLISMPLAIIALVVETRYRFLSYPFLAIFGGYGASLLLVSKKINWQVIFMVSGIFIANGIYDILRNLDRILERI